MFLELTLGEKDKEGKDDGRRRWLCLLLVNLQCCFLLFLQVPSEQEAKGVERLVSGGERVKTLDIYIYT